MKIIIDIPKEMYEAYKNRPPMLGDAGMDMIAQSIAKGTPLPEGHGRLIDADKIIALAHEEGAYDYVSAKEIADAPTIIDR